MSGKDAGKKGSVVKVFPVKGKIIVDGVNVVTRHMKKQGTTPGQKVELVKPIDASNVMLECPITQKPTRVGYVMIDDKTGTKKFRYSKRAVKETNKPAKDCIIK